MSVEGIVATSAHEAAQWLRDAVTKDGVATIVKAATRTLKSIEFDTIVFRGMSGALIAPIIAHKMGKEIVMLRKPDAATHSGYKYEGFIDVKRYVIIDDFVSSGDTVATIINRMRSAGDSKFVGLYLYYSNTERAGFYTPEVPADLFGRINKFITGEKL